MLAGSGAPLSAIDDVEGSTHLGIEGSTHVGVEGSTNVGVEGSTNVGVEGSTNVGVEGSTHGSSAEGSASRRRRTICVEHTGIILFYFYIGINLVYFSFTDFVVDPFLTL